MKINSSTIENLLNRSISPSSVLFWIYVSFINKDRDGFIHLDQNDISIKFHCSTRQIQNHISTLYESRLIEKDYRTLDTGSRLFIKPVEPESEDDMTFFGEFDSIDRQTHYSGGESFTINLRDVRNIYDTINYKWQFIHSSDMKCEFPKNLENGDWISFKAKVVRRGDGILFKNVHKFGLREWN